MGLESVLASEDVIGDLRGLYVYVCLTCVVRAVAAGEPEWDDQ